MVDETKLPLWAVGLVCSLKPNPAPSSSALAAEHVFGELNGRDVESSHTDDNGTPAMVCNVATVSVVGNDGGAHKVVADLFQALNDIDYTIPAQGCTYLNRAAMETTDYNDLDGVPEQISSATAAAARSTAHLARTMQDRQYPRYDT